MEPNTLLPWYVGPNRATNVTRVEMQRRAREILESKDYQDSVLRRIRKDDLPPAIEALFYYYAYGKPVEQVAVQVSHRDDTDMSSYSIEDLENTAKQALAQLEAYREIERSIPAQFTKEQEVA